MTWDELSLFGRAIEKVQNDKAEGERWRGDLIVGFTAAYIRLLLFQFKNLLSLEPGSLVGLPIHDFWRKGPLKEDASHDWETYFSNFQRFRYKIDELKGPVDERRCLEASFRPKAR